MRMKLISGITKAKPFLCGAALSTAILAAGVGISAFVSKSFSRKIASVVASHQLADARQNEDAAARFTWDVRSATSVASATDNQLILNTPEGPVTYTFASRARTLTRTKGAQTSTLLTGVESATFSLYESPTRFNRLLPATTFKPRVVGLKWANVCAAGATQKAMAALQVASL